MKALFKIISISTILCSCQLFTPKPQSESFYCKIDGKAFRPDNGGDIFFSALLAQKDETYNFFYITTTGKEGKGLSISSKIFKNWNDFKVKKYLINEEFNAYYSGNYIEKDGKRLQERFEPYPNSGYVEFTKIDTVKQTVSGVFEFKLKSTQTDKTVSIKNGQFNDVFYY